MNPLLKRILTIITAYKMIEEIDVKQSEIKSILKFIDFRLTFNQTYRVIKNLLKKPKMFSDISGHMLTELRMRTCCSYLSRTFILSFLRHWLKNFKIIPAEFIRRAGLYAFLTVDTFT